MRVLYKWRYKYVSNNYFKENVEKVKHDILSYAIDKN